MKINSSFRDPSGNVFVKNGIVYRKINASSDYDMLMKSGLYDELTKNNFLVKHEEIKPDLIKPEPIKFISYPYEWCFSQYKDAALLTLKIQEISLKKGLSLKDASAYNIQFHNGKPIFIDTLSFEKYEDEKPWAAYKQFCQHFLSPLALMAYKDVRLNKLMASYIDGIPLDLASKILPGNSLFNFSLLSHIHLHAATQKRYTKKIMEPRLSKNTLLALIDSLQRFIEKLWITGKDQKSDWDDYYSKSISYNSNSFNHKKELVKQFLLKAKPNSVIDFGANRGDFTRLSSEMGIFTLSIDNDHNSVEHNYIFSKSKASSDNVLPLIVDISNPSSAIGWNSDERNSFVDRITGDDKFDMAFVLAIIHHLSISNNIPLQKSAEFFSNSCKWLIIEFVLPEDPMVIELLSSRKNVFNYSLKEFERSFAKFFEIRIKEKINDSNRILYLMKLKK